ncbi:MAG: saccharopine dehydrogenase NADP-binding domain-containing protein [Planctomycetes bacterium]|nr:saccharopine dehydrogenase NADP-binding domain-containing protein [Planctomycetota bacterium]
MITSRRFDVIIHGATGFTGRLAARELCNTAGQDLRWAISGRNAERLKQMSAELGCDYVVADSLNESQLDELTSQTKVVLSCAGPFAAFGEKLVASCVKNKCHYADLTGESHWAIKMASRYEEAAVAAGITLIPSSGFDSVPASLGAQHFLQRITDKGRSIQSFGSYYSMRGGLNGGTLASGLQLAEDGLSVPDCARPGVFKVEALNRYATEFVMAPINERVVGLDTNVEYHEHILTPNKISAYMVKWYFDMMGWMMSHKFGRSVLRKLGPKPGEGPSDKVIASGFVKQTFLEDDSANPLKIVFTWPGDPGNTVTVRCLIHTGLALVADEAQAVGFTTPAAGLGDKLLQRLLAAEACSYECNSATG